MATITYDQLAREGACYGALSWFRERFGQSVTVTVRLAGRHAEELSGLRLEWLVDHLLAYPQQKKFDRARSAISEGAVLRQLPWNITWDPEIPELSDAYEKARMDAQAKYDRICAITFARLYIAQEDARESYRQ
jgi:hypothetical protein